MTPQAWLYTRTGKFDTMSERNESDAHAAPSWSWTVSCGALVGFLAIIYASQPIANNFDQGRFFLAALALPALGMLLAVIIVQRFIDARMLLLGLLCFQVIALLVQGALACRFETWNGDHAIFIAGYMTVYHQETVTLALAGLPSLLYVSSLLSTREHRMRGASTANVVNNVCLGSAGAAALATVIVIVADRASYGIAHLVMAGMLVAGNALEAVQGTRHDQVAAVAHAIQGRSRAKATLTTIIMLLVVFVAIYSWSIDFTWQGTFEGSEGFWSATLNERLALPEAAWTLGTFAIAMLAATWAGRKVVNAIGSAVNAELVLATITIGLIASLWGLLQLGTVPFGFRFSSLVVPWIVVAAGCWVAVYVHKRAVPSSGLVGSMMLGGFLATWLGMLLGPETLDGMDLIVPVAIAVIAGLVAVMLGFVTPRMLEGRTLRGSGRPATGMAIASETVDKQARRVGVNAFSKIAGLAKPRKGALAAIAIAAAIALPAVLVAVPATAPPSFQLLATVDNQALFFLADPTTRVHPDHRPWFGLHGVAVPNNTITITAARNEHEAVQVVMRPVNQKHFSIYGISFSEFVHAGGGDPIPASTCQAFRVRPVEPLAGMVPDVLEPFAPFGVADGRNHPLWFRFYVPANASPGEYTGAISLVVDNKEEEWSLHPKTLVLDVRLHVFNFTLPSIPSLKSNIGFYTSRPEFNDVMAIFQRNRMMHWSFARFPVIASMHANGSIDAMNFTATDADVTMIHDYGTRTIGFHVPGSYGHVLPDGTFTVNGADFTRSNYTTSVHFNGTMQEYFQRFADHYKNITYIDDFGTNKSWFNEMYFNGHDEVDGVGGTYKINALAEYRWLAALDCPFPLMQTVGGRVEETFAVLEAMPGGAIICWHTTGFEEPHVTAWKASGRNVWIYTTRGPRFPSPSISTSGMATQVRALGWQCFLYNYTNYLIWDIATPGNARQGHAYQGWSGGSMLYPAPGGGYHESTRLELLREGFEDHEYFTLLARQPPSAARDALLDRVKALMPGPWFQPTMDYRAVQQLRASIGAFLSA